MTQPEQEAREMLAREPHDTHCDYLGRAMGPCDCDRPIRAMQAFAARPTAGIDREVLAKHLYEQNPYGDQETDLDGRPTGPGYEIQWDQLPEYAASAQEEFLSQADAILALLPAAAKTGERGAVIEECARVRCVGVSRMFDNDKAVLLSLRAKPSDDDLRAIHTLLGGE